MKDFCRSLYFKVKRETAAVDPQNVGSLWNPAQTLTPLVIAEQALAEAERRRKNLEQNLVNIQRTKQTQGVFDILGLLGQDEYFCHFINCFFFFF